MNLTEHKASLPYSEALVTWPCPGVGWIQYTHSRVRYSRSVLLLSFHLRVGRPDFRSGFSTRSPYGFLFFPVRATCPTYNILDVFILILLSGRASNEAHLSGFSSLRLPPPSWSRIPSSSSSCFRPRVTYGLALYSAIRDCKPLVMVAIICCCNSQELCILPLRYIYVFFIVSE